jgi:hypothetical protein
LEAVTWFNEKYPALAKTLKVRARKTEQLSEDFWEKKLAELKAYQP